MHQDILTDMETSDIFPAKHTVFRLHMYYLDVNFYRYFIGRSDQSVNEKVMTGRIDQQIKVYQIMTDYFVEKKSEIMGNKPLA